LQEQMWKYLQDLVGAHPRLPVLITGHSLGGAMAELAAAEFASRPYASGAVPRIELYTFGAPRVGNTEFANWIVALFCSGGHEVYRVTHMRDPVPHLPPMFMGFEHEPHEVWYDNAGSTSYRNCSDAAGHVLLLGSVTVWIFGHAVVRAESCFLGVEAAVFTSLCLCGGVSIFWLLFGFFRRFLGYLRDIPRLLVRAVMHHTFCLRALCACVREEDDSWGWGACGVQQGCIAGMTCTKAAAHAVSLSSSFLSLFYLFIFVFLPNVAGACPHARDFRSDLIRKFNLPSPPRSVVWRDKPIFNDAVFVGGEAGQVQRIMDAAPNCV
ncbi:lipase, partial [Trypanosoma rangeli]